MIRNPAQAERIESAGAEAFIADLEGDIENNAGPAVEGCGAIIFAAGGGRGSGPEKKETVDYMGAVKLIEAAEAAGARRFILLSSIRIDYPDTWLEHLRAYLTAKEKADRPPPRQRTGLHHRAPRPPDGRSRRGPNRRYI